ncbi:MAG: glycosyltransferase family 4 protein [Chloroflexota bacterium]|nr:glycosyltransferase family 4 protein [Chloroflexota bacterium]
MHVGINAQIVTFSAGYRRAGVSRFTEQLILSLQSRYRSSRFSVFVNETAAPGDFTNSANFIYHRSRLPTSLPAVRIAWEQLLLPVIARGMGVDVLHCPVNVSPLLAPCPTALTIHDLTFLLFPDRFNWERQRYLAALTRASARRASRVMTDSEWTKRDVTRLLRVPPEKIQVVYPGLDETFFPRPAEELREFRRQRHLPERFLLYLGTLEPRKNIELLVQAYSLLLKQGLRSCPLVIAGGKGWRFDRIFAEVARHGLTDQVLFPGYVDPADQPLWYGAATLFVYPSLYEGFGLPPLEAMACGTPVITSNASSLPEVVGRAGITVNPNSASDLAGAIAEVLGSQEKRDQMIQAGLRQAATFSWREAAQRTQQVYEQVASST